MAQQSAVPAVLPESPGSVPSIHMVGHITGNSSFRGPEAFRRPPREPGTYMVHIHTCRHSTPARK